MRGNYFGLLKIGNDFVVVGFAHDEPHPLRQNPVCLASRAVCFCP